MIAAKAKAVVRVLVFILDTSDDIEAHTRPTDQASSRNGPPAHVLGRRMGQPEADGAADCMSRFLIWSHHTTLQSNMHRRNDGIRLNQKDRSESGLCCVR
jgi:hypothetical protein